MGSQRGATVERRFDGRQVAAAYQAGASQLTRHAARVDALNVFPVPDGDTGTNMRLTFAAAVTAIEQQPDADAGAVAQVAAEAALLGARGNSGVILSQILAGVAAALRGRATVGTVEIVCAGEEAARFAYRAVSEPVEGTMLTTIKAVAGAVRAAGERGEAPFALLEAATKAAHASVERSPSLLAKLREAGVVDAGAEGLAVILDGMYRAAGGTVMETTLEAEFVRPTAVAMAEGAHSLDESGYCTNFLVRGVTADIEVVRPTIQSLGTSVVVAGTGSLIKVHLHTEHPGLALEAGARLGELTAIEIMNMRDQVATLRAQSPAQPGPPTDQPSPVEAAVIAVAPSSEIVAIFGGFSAAAILGGQSMNPSVSQLRTAIAAANADHVFVLPNNANIVLTAREAARLSLCEVTVIPTTTVPQGVAAAVAFLADRSVADNAQAMTAAAQTVTTVEVTIAARDTTVAGVTVAAGQAIAIVDGALTASGDDAEQAALHAVRSVFCADHTLITIYYGATVHPAQVALLEQSLAEQLPAAQLEVVAGGQPHYPYILALE